MKKVALLVLFCLLMSVFTAGFASTTEMIVPLYDQREKGSVFIGTVVSAGEGYYVSGGVGNIEYVQPYILTQDGLFYVSHLQQFTNGMALFTTKSTQEAAPISTQEIKGTVLMASYGPQGMQIVTGKVLYPLTWRNAPCYLIESGVELSMGAAVMDGANALLGVVTAGWGEGVNRYVMLPVSSFTVEEGKNNEAAPTEEPAAFHQWVEGCEVVREGIILKVKWDTTALENLQEDSRVSVIIADEGNSYYSWVYDDAAKGEVHVPVAPGRTYYYAVQHSHGDTVRNVDWMEKAEKITVEAGVPFHLYSYEDVSIYLGTLPVKMDGFSTTEANPVEKITRELLEDENISLFLQVTSRYQVEKEETCDMLVTLTTPDGSMFLEPASYIFMPDIMEKDVWNANLDGMLDDYLKLKKTFEAGEYVIQYYFDNALVNTVRFTLE